MELEGGVETLERKKQGPPRSVQVKEEGIDGRLGELQIWGKEQEMRVQSMGKVTKNLDGVMTEKWVQGPRFSWYLSSILSGSAVHGVSCRLCGQGREGNGQSSCSYWCCYIH